MPAFGGAGTSTKPAKLSGDFGARSGAIGSLASANGFNDTTTETGSVGFRLVPDATAGVSPVSMTFSLSSGHLNLSQPTGSCARQGVATAKATTAAMNADFTAASYSTAIMTSEALITAMAATPAFSPSSSTASLVIEAMIT